jgi:hypothetical protein
MNKHKLAGSVLALTTLLGGQVFADPSQSANVEMGGTVDKTCTLSPMTQFSGTGATLASEATATSATVNLTALANLSDATFQETGFELNYNGMCNYAHSVSIQTVTGNLKATNTANSPVAGSLPFVTALNFTAANSWAGDTRNLATNGTALRKSVVTISRAASGQGRLLVSILPPADETMPLIAGTWSDQIKLQIGAAL